MTTEPRAFDFGPQHHVGGAITLKTPLDFLPWQPGDVILDADRAIYIRVRYEDSGDGQWPWRSDVYRAPVDRGYAGEGGTPDHMIQRPVTLLIRDGKPIGGMLIDDLAEAHP